MADMGQDDTLKCTGGHIRVDAHVRKSHHMREQSTKEKTMDLFVFWKIIKNWKLIMTVSEGNPSKRDAQTYLYTHTALLK